MELSKPSVNGWGTCSLGLQLLQKFWEKFRLSEIICRGEFYPLFYGAQGYVNVVVLILGQYVGILWSLWVYFMKRALSLVEGGVIRRT